MTYGLTAPQRARYSDHSLAAYLAPLLEGRRVAVVGPTSGEVARRFRALGVSTVVAFGGTGEGIAVRALTPGALEAFHGKIDGVVVPDAAAVPLDRVLDEARRALGSDGIVAVASHPTEAPIPLEGKSANGPGYYELHDALSARFSHVYMLGRGPFLGYAIAGLTQSAEGITLDTRLMPGEPSPAEAYIAVASDRPLPLEGVTLVQIPLAEVWPLTAPVASESTDKLATLEDELTKREQKIKELENTAAERWVQVQRLEHELKSLDEDARKARDRAARLARELDDERKLRQRIELEAQMARRATELPKAADTEELHRTRARIAELEQALENARTELADKSRRLEELQRELDETHATENALRAELDAADEARREAQRELQNARTRAASHIRIEEELAAARAEIERLRVQLSAPQTTLEGESAEYAKLEKELRARAEEIIALRAQVAERDAAIRELSYSLEVSERSDRAVELQQARERIAQLRSLGAGLAAETSRIVEENELLRERIANLEKGLLQRTGELQQSRLRVAEIESRLRTIEESTTEQEAVARALQQARSESEELRERYAKAEDVRRQAEQQARALEEQLRGAHRALDDARSRCEELTQQLRYSEQALDQERSRCEELTRQLAEARSDLSRQYALTASLEERATEIRLELQGARAGYECRIRELEHEVERLVQALEVSTREASEESRAVEELLNKLALAEAERLGLQMRLNDAETALAQRAGATHDSNEAVEASGAKSLQEPPIGRSGEDEPSALSQPSVQAPVGIRTEQLLSDLAETAARLAATEEALAASREAAAAAEKRVAELSSMLATLQQERTTNAGASAEAFEALRREAAERELLTRSLLAQLEDRDLRLRAMERRLVEEVERARRTESEIWEVELRSRDQHIAALSREIERLRAEHSGTPAGNGGETAELTALRASLEEKERQLQALRGALDQVRAQLSSILVDGRGAVVAHDLVTILRQIEEPLA